METLAQLLIEEKFLYKQLIHLLEEDPNNDVRKSELKSAIVEKDLKIKQYFEEKKKNNEKQLIKPKNYHKIDEVCFPKFECEF